MTPRPAAETIAILRRTLDQIEKDLDPVVDAAPLSELKRVVLHRIAELELEKALGAARNLTTPLRVVESSDSEADTEQTAA